MKIKYFLCFLVVIFVLAGCDKQQQTKTQQRFQYAKQHNIKQTVIPDLTFHSNEHLIILGDLSASSVANVNPIPLAASCINAKGSCTAEVKCPGAKQKFVPGGYGFFIVPSHNSKTGVLDGGVCGTGHIQCGSNTNDCKITSSQNLSQSCSAPDWLHQIVVLKASCES